MAFQRVPVSDFTAGELSRKFHGRFDLELFAKGCEWLENWVVFSQGGMTTRPPTKHLGSTLSNLQGRLIPFVVSDTDAFVVELTALSMRIWDGDAVILTAPSFPITTTYTLDEIPYIQTQKVANQLFLVHRNHPIAVLTWEGLKTFSLADQTITFGTDVEAWTASTVYHKDDIVSNGTPMKIYRCAVGGTSGDSGPSSEADLIVDGTAYWTWQYTKPFSQVDDYPGAVGYFIGRMWYGGSNNHPDGVWSSLPYEFGCFDYFDMMSYEGTALVDSTLWAYPEVPETETVTYNKPVIGDGNAIFLQLASDQDESVMWLVGSDALVVGTGTSEWVISPEVSALNVQAKIRSRIGSAQMQAMIVGENPMFIQGTRSRGYLREYAYLSQTSELDSPDLSYMAEQMLDAGIEQMDFQQVPQPMWYGVSDGSLMVLLYSRQYKTAAWFRMTTAEGGDIESVAVISGTTDDRVYLIVNRPGGRYVERLEGLWDSTKIPLDSYVYVAACGVSTIGLDRFDGDTVVVYNATHGTYRTTTVAAGVCDTTADSSDAIWIGLPITCKAKTMKLQTGSVMGSTGQTAIKRVNSVIARVMDSREFEAGIALADLEVARRMDDVKWTSSYTGDVRIPLEANWEREGCIWLVQDKPYKTTILALVMEADV